MFVLGLLAAVLDVDVVVDHAAFERPGAIERVGGDDVVKMVGLHPLQQVANATAFQLEDALGFAARQQRKGFFVVERKLVQVDPLAGRLLDQVDGLARGSSGCAGPGSPSSAGRPLRRRSSTTG